MSLLLRWSSLCPMLVRSSPLHSNGCSSPLLQTPPFTIRFAHPCGNGLGQPVVWYANEYCPAHLEKKVPLELVDDPNKENIGSSHGWIATLKDDGIVRLQDDFNPVASDSKPKRISLPPLVTLPRCQTRIVTNVAMSSSSPEEEDCVVAIKFLGNQLSYCRPAQTNPEWINIKIQNPCFFSSPVMFSKKDGMFRIPGSGGHIIGSWDPHKYHHSPKVQKLRFRNLSKTKRAFRDSCFRSEHLVESRSTGETFLVKWYRKYRKITSDIEGMKTEALMVFKLDEEGNAVYTEDIGDLCIFLSKSEPFCVPASSFPGMPSNQVHIFDVDEAAVVSLADHFIDNFDTENFTHKCGAPYHIPPQNIN